MRLASIYRPYGDLSLVKMHKKSSFKPENDGPYPIAEAKLIGELIKSPAQSGLDIRQADHCDNQQKPVPAQHGYSSQMVLHAQQAH